MIVLRLTQIVTAPDSYRIEFALEGGASRMVATATFQYCLSAQTQEKIRWYLEEYAKNVYKPDTALAQAIEREITTSD